MYSKHANHKCSYIHNPLDCQWFAEIYIQSRIVKVLFKRDTSIRNAKLSNSKVAVISTKGVLYFKDYQVYFSTTFMDKKAYATINEITFQVLFFNVIDSSLKIICEKHICFCCNRGTQLLFMEIGYNVHLI